MISLPSHAGGDENTERQLIGAGSLAHIDSIQNIMKSSAGVHQSTAEKQTATGTNVSTGPAKKGMANNINFTGGAVSLNRNSPAFIESAAAFKSVEYTP
mmetsp:Transcript_28181/g.42664  ORF Transcript_28181/g.42664 Transcript_28181/m.42664 type:complete len:99 (+) Transcript_28181:410-706(+)